MSTLTPDAETPRRRDTRGAPRPPGLRVAEARHSLVRPAIAVVAIVALANALMLSALPLEMRFPGALVLFVGLPGYLLIESAFVWPRPRRLERYLLAFGCGYILAVMLMFLLYAVFRPLQTIHVLAGASLLNIGLLLVLLARRAHLPDPGHWTKDERRRTNSWSFVLRPWSKRRGDGVLWPVLVLAVAAPLRLYNLGHSEFQGDEALVLLRTMALVQGVPDALIAHRKVPGEILLNAIFTAGLAGTTELVGRLPFSLAGLGALLAVYRLGCAMFGPAAGLTAALLLAVNGYFVAFGRILQYQSVGFLLDTLAILCLFRFARESNAHRGYAVVGGMLMAGSALMGLGAVFLLPLAALALSPRLLGPNRLAWRDMAIWLWPFALLVPTALAIYFFLARGSADALEVGSAWRYLGPRVGGDRPYFNLSGLLLSANHYTSTLYLAAVLGAGVVLVVKTLVERLQPGRSPRHALAWRMAVLWMIAPLLTYLFLVRQPGTHYREVFPGLALLVAGASAGLYTRLPGPRSRLLAVLAGCAFLAASAHYVYVAWIQPWPEYQLMYPLHRHPLDWTSLEVRSAGGTFGAARRHGWKTVAELMAAGEVSGNYTTNERPAEAAWYMKRSWICRRAAELIVHAPRTRVDRGAIENGAAPHGYYLTAQVYVGGHPTLSLLSRDPPPDGPRMYMSRDYGARFDRELSSPWIPVGGLYRPELNRAPECPRT